MCLSHLYFNRFSLQSGQAAGIKLLHTEIWRFPVPLAVISLSHVRAHTRTRTYTHSMCYLEFFMNFPIAIVYQAEFTFCFLQLQQESQRNYTRLRFPFFKTLKCVLLHIFSQEQLHPASVLIICKAQGCRVKLVPIIVMNGVMIYYLVDF